MLMLKPASGVTPEGLPFITLGAFLTLLAAILGWELVCLVLLVLTLFTAYFFRDPQRVVPNDAGLCVSPADGKVVRVAPAVDPLTGEQRVCVSIFMNVFNVHVNRMPVSGRVTDIVYIPGKFLNASLDKASEHNERCLLHLEDRDGEDWTMVQIAGLVARRIVCRAEPGDELRRGERFGVIRFGSRVDLYLPDGYSPCLQNGDKTVAGQTLLARCNMC